jgi:DNA-binding CsgD family transcriptional regulator
MMARTDQLSKREREVAELLLQGKSNKQIALGLGIAESTVEFHLKNVYAKLKVSSRAEAILKLGKSTGRIDENLGESIVERKSETRHTTVKFIPQKDAEMKNRLLSYFLAGLVFGIIFWFYFSAIGSFMSRLGIDEENGFIIWLLLSIEFLFIFGVWLIPTIVPVAYEFHLSKKVSLSVVAVILMWISAVLGYYLIYVVLLAFVGLPHMQYYLVFGQRGPTFWQDWAELFPKLILYDFLKWTVVGLIVGGFAGLLTSSFYSFWVKKTNSVMPT